jgi:prevent-host-death family protein
MNIVNIHEAKTHLSKLIEKAVQGEPFVIAKAGKPMVKVIAVDTPAEKKKKRLGFMKGKISVPDNFDRLYEREIEEMFYGKK